MKTILCFGDSNTWGANPVEKNRYSLQQRWPSVMHRDLGGEYLVIAEGQPGRTTVWQDPIEGGRAGIDALIPCLESHAPLDLVIILLGTNDLKQRFSLTATDIALGAQRLVGIVMTKNCGPFNSTPKVLLVAPPPVLEFPGSWEPMKGSQLISRDFGISYRKVSEQTKCEFFDAGSVVQSSPVDGFHWGPEGHLALGHALSVVCRHILEERQQE